MSEVLQVVILAAGKGTRMQSELPKVLHQAAGRSLLSYAVEAAQALRPERVVVVVGHGSEQVKVSLGRGAGNKILFALQEPQLGTGHAVQMAASMLLDDDKDGDVLVTYGDMPLLSSATLAKIRDSRRQNAAAASVLTATVDDPGSFGRIVRDEHGSFLRIVEHKDCSTAQRLINEVNIAVYCFGAALLKDALGALKNDNAQGEYYLTDLMEIMRAQGHKVVTVNTEDPGETLGVNNLTDLAKAEAVIVARRAASTSS